MFVFVPVDSKVLKAEDVQQTDGASDGFGLRGRRLVDGSVDLLHNPHEQAAVNTLNTHTASRSQTYLHDDEWSFYDVVHKNKYVSYSTGQ